MMLAATREVCLGTPRVNYQQRVESVISYVAFHIFVQDHNTEAVPLMVELSYFLNGHAFYEMQKRQNHTDYIQTMLH